MSGMEEVGHDTPLVVIDTPKGPGGPSTKEQRERFEHNPQDGGGGEQVLLG